MTMTSEDSETFRKELDSFTLRKDVNRVEFTLSRWHVVMYRIPGQEELVRVDFRERWLRSDAQNPFRRSP